MFPIYCWAMPLSIIWKDRDLDLNVKCLTFLPDSIRIWTFMTDFHKSPPYQMSRNLCSAAGAAVHIRTQTGEMDMTWKANRCISWLCEWAEQAHKNIKNARHTPTWQPIHCAVEAVIVCGCHCCIELQLVLIRFWATVATGCACRLPCAPSCNWADRTWPCVS